MPKNIKECCENKDHDEGLKEFLALVLESEEAIKMKKCSKRVKLRAQALELKHAPAEKSQGNTEQNKQKQKQEKNTKMLELEKTIKEMNEQM